MIYNENKEICIPKPLFYAALSILKVEMKVSISSLCSLPSSKIKESINKEGFFFFMDGVTLHMHH